MTFAQMLQKQGLTSGPVFATGLIKCRDMARMIADTKAQETIRADHARVITEAEPGSVAQLVERLSTFYHSDYVKLNQPWLLETPFEQWRDRQLAAKGLTL